MRHSVVAAASKSNSTLVYSTPLWDEPSGVGSNLQVGGHNAGAKRRPKIFRCAPPLFPCAPPHEGAQQLFVTD